MDTLIGPVPAEWAQIKVADICNVLAGPSGASLKPTARQPTGIPVVTPRDFRNNRIVNDNIACVDPETAEKFARYRLIPGDVLCARSGELGRQALIGNEQAGWLFGSACLRLRTTDSISPRYLSYYLSHPSVRDWILRNAAGSAIPSLSTRTFQSMPVVLPPLALQSTIGEILGALDDKAAIHDQIAQAAIALRDAVIPLLVSGSPRIAQ